MKYKKGKFRVVESYFCNIFELVSSYKKHPESYMIASNKQVGM